MKHRAKRALRMALGTFTATLATLSACTSDDEPAGAGDRACPSGSSLCEGACLDTTDNALNCGACGQTCSPGQLCAEGACSCLAELESCDGACVDTSSDPAHCGSCSGACAATEVCSRGTCANECDAGLEQCGRSCVELQKSSAHCGACDAACPTGRSCQGGTCSCPAGQMDCGGSCVDLQTNGQHCGTCGNACSGGACNAGSCEGGGGGAGGGGGGTGATGGSSGATGGGGASAGNGGGGAGTSGTGGAAGSGGAASGDAGPLPPISDFIVVDQFGYLPDSEKIAVARDPVTGWDSAESFTPGSTYAVIDSATGAEVFSGSVSAWNGGAEDPSSGDRAWWFDFSSVRTPGDYYVLDVDQDVRSAVFSIRTDVYRVVLEQAVRTFFYQRAGFAKEATYAGAAWADGASHMGPLQDQNARRYDAPSDAATERDLRGGWYDAGDYNKYTNWTADYVIELLAAYEQNPSAFSDATDIPESGNGIPDILDEVKWGLDHLVRMQNPDGSVLSIVGLDGASPPSAATGQSLYGTASTSSTLTTAAAYARGATVFGGLGNATLSTYASDLLARAASAWTWAVANPNVTFRNNDGSAGTAGLGAGQQEVDDYGRTVKRVQAACYLYEATSDTTYRDAFDAEYDQIHLIAWNYAYPFEEFAQDMLLHCANVSGATGSVASAIESVYDAAMDGADNFQAFDGNVDPYLAHIADYTWGSNATKSRQGNMFAALYVHGVDTASEARARRAAQRYLHYLHGVNPFGLAYLSNMYAYGGDKTVNEFYHTWFADGSADWDRVGVSTYGPAPGFLTGGPNPTYSVDGCCPSNCAGLSCSSEPLSPPLGQPDQKSYKDFNTSWPINSWAVTENSNGYQAAYIKLLSKFVE